MCSATTAVSWHRSYAAAGTIAARSRASIWPIAASTGAVAKSIIAESVPPDIAAAAVTSGSIPSAENVAAIGSIRAYSTEASGATCTAPGPFAADTGCAPRAVAA